MSSESLSAESERPAVESWRGRRVVVLGDLYLDEYVYGTALDISPEMPVLRVVESRTTHALGAAANVAANLRAMGAEVEVVGTLGTDPHGDRIVELLEELDIGSAGVLRAAERRTGAFTRVVVEGGDGLEHHQLRLDRESRDPIEDDRRDELLARLGAALEGAEALFVADYDETAARTGVVTPSLVRAALPLARRYGALVAGMSRRHVAELVGLDCVFVNAAEARDLGVDASRELVAGALDAVRRSQLGALVVTLGERGAVVVADGEDHRVDAGSTNVVDTCGAGDSFASGFVLSRLAGADLRAAAGVGRAASAIAVRRRGTYAVTAAELDSELRYGGHGGTKLLDRHDLRERIGAHRGQRTIVFTNGFFDLFHSGHVELLRQARTMGDILVVGINSDRSTRENKGEGRPLLSERDRIDILASLEFVDHVTVFDELTPINAIRALRPDVIVKGGNYRPEEVVGKDIVESYGGRVVVIPYVGTLSTTHLIRAIKDASDGTRGE